MSRDDLAAFLKSRRAAIEPAQVGLPDAGRRRASGLRREEVALLAGVSVTWYTWLEQARPINASQSVLDALARALLLDDAQHAHLLALAAPEVELPDQLGVDPPPDALVRLIEAFDPNPSYILGPRWELLAWNEAQRRLYPRIAELDDADRNLLWIVFRAPGIRELIVDWEREARRMLMQFRADTTAIRADPAVVELVGRLAAVSPEFAGWWSDLDVTGFHTRLRRYHHPHAGDLVFEYQQLAPAEWPDFRVVCQLAVPGDDSAARLRQSSPPSRSGRENGPSAVHFRGPNAEGTG